MPIPKDPIKYQGWKDKISIFLEQLEEFLTQA